MSIVPRVMYPIHDYREYEPRDSLFLASKVALPGFAIGLSYAAARERITHFQAPLAESMLRVGRQSSLIAFTGVTFQFVEAASSNLREKEDAWNHFYGGLAAGALWGIQGRTITNTFFTSLAIGSIMGLARWAGNLYTTSNEKVDKEDSAFSGEESTFFTIRDRQPLSETLSKLGEGRGLHYPKGSKPVESEE
ncbi:hypothetical protein V1511DRAFT_179615 [Dipodascopsis uninucleata]